MSYTGNLNTHRGLVGKVGEDMACEYLIDKGHKIVERNRRIKYGEIDIISFYKNTLHFIEVKTVTVYNDRESVSAEEHLDFRKMRKIANLAEIYFKDYVNKIKSENKELQISLDFIGVYIDQNKNLKKINFLESLEI